MILLTNKILLTTVLDKLKINIFQPFSCENSGGKNVETLSYGCVEIILFILVMFPIEPDW
jgi:hypothetical protein